MVAKRKAREREDKSEPVAIDSSSPYSRDESKENVIKARNRFRNEMAHEGYTLTPLGNKMEQKIFDTSKSVSEYHKGTMQYFSGDKSEEGKYWVKADKGSKGNMDMAAEFTHMDLGTRARSVF